jgi:hypothetical protein
LGRGCSESAIGPAFYRVIFRRLAGATAPSATGFLAEPDDAIPKGGDGKGDDSKGEVTLEIQNFKL